MAVTTAPRPRSSQTLPAPSDARDDHRDGAPGASRPARLDGADALRALAALAVIVVHTAHWPLQSHGADAAVWYSVTLVARFCVPAFVLLTGLVLAYRYGEEKLGRDFLLRRARRSVVPWLIWAPIFCLFDIFVIGGLQPSWDAVRDWWSTGGGHLYFLILVPQLYVLMLVWPSRRRASMIAAGVAVAVQLALCTVRLYVPMPGGALHQGVLAHGFEEFPFWVGYFAIGVAAGRMLAARGGRGGAAWPFALLVAPATALLLWVDVSGAVNAGYGDGTGAFLRPLMLPLTLAVCGAVVLGAPSLLRRTPRLRRATSVVGRHSLGIYIVHPLLLAWLGKLLMPALQTHLPWSIAALAGLTAATAISALMVAALLARTPLAPIIGEERRRRGDRRGAERERELVGQRAREASPQRSSMRATSSSLRSSAGGGGAPSTRST